VLSLLLALLRSQVYNKNGRIGIYTPAERAAIIERFLQKRSRRVWNKKIRYDCRKDLADRRLRVKGRFVKRSEQEHLERTQEQKQQQQPQPQPHEEEAHGDNGGAAKKSVSVRFSDSEEDEGMMPDVNDPDAGFVPTEDQPYRRLRRHTVT
jgi:CCT motif